MVKQKIGRWTSDASNCHMFLVDKENGSPKDSEEAWRPVCSLVHVNKYIKPREYNAEPIGLLIQKLQNGKLFNKFDHPNAYHGLKMVSDQKIIAKIPGQTKNFEYHRCVQGLKTSGIEFNAAFDEIFKGIPIIRYSDDSAQNAVSEADLLRDLDIFLAKCEERNVPLSLKKCLFGVEEMEFLSYKIVNGRVGISDAHRKAVEELDGSTMKSDSLAGFLAYFDSFHGDYDLLHVLRENSPWDDNKELALEWLKAKILNAPLKALVDFKSPLKLFIDASDTGFSSCLFIEKTGKNNQKFIEPVSFFKRNMTNHPSWQNKSTYEKELFGLVASVKRNEYLLKGPHKVDIYCDNQAVVESKNSKSFQIRHFFDTLKIEYPNITIRHIESKFNTVADLLSKAKHSKITEENVVAQIPLENIFPVSTRSSTLTKNKNEKSSLKLSEDSDSKKSLKNTENEKMLLKLTNFHIRSGHISAERVFSLYQRIYGKNHPSKITRDQLVAHFRACKCYTPKANGNFIPIQPSTNAELYLDFKTLGAHSCPLKNKAKSYRLSVIEPLSGAIWSFPVPVCTGTELVDAMRFLLQVHGMVGTIKADNAPSFIFGEFADFCKKYDIKLNAITPGNAQSNLAERQHSSLNKAIVLAHNLTEKVSLAESKDIIFDFVLSHNLVAKRDSSKYCPMEILKGQLPKECVRLVDNIEISQSYLTAPKIIEEVWASKSKRKLDKCPESAENPKFSPGCEVYWKVKNPTNEVQYRLGKVIDSNPTSTLLKLSSGKIRWVVNRFIISKPDYNKLLGL